MIIKLEDTAKEMTVSLAFGPWALLPALVGGLILYDMLSPKFSSELSPELPSRQSVIGAGWPVNAPVSYEILMSAVVVILLISVWFLCVKSVFKFSKNTGRLEWSRRRPFWLENGSLSLSEIRDIQREESYSNGKYSYRITIYTIDDQTLPITRIYTNLFPKRQKMIAEKLRAFCNIKG